MSSFSPTRIPCTLLKGLNGSSWKSILTHFSPVAPGSLDTRMNRASGKKPSPEQGHGSIIS